MNTKLILTAFAAVALGSAVGWNVPHQSTLLNASASMPAIPGSTNAADKKILYYTCSMHPSVKSDKPGDCPICGMKLQTVYASETNAPVMLPGCCGGGTCQ